MKPYTLPIIILTLVVIVLAAGLVYYIQLYSLQEAGTEDVTNNGNGEKENVAYGDDFSCKKEEYKDLEICQYVDIQIQDIEMETDMKTDLPYSIKVTLYNAGKDSTQGYEVRQYYYDPSKKIRVEIGSGYPVSGVHNSGQIRETTLTWVPSVTGRYKYGIELNKVKEAGMTDINLQKGLTNFNIFVNVAESSMACQVTLDPATNKITLSQDDNKCDIVKNSDVSGEVTGIASMTNNQYAIAGEHIIQFTGYLGYQTKDTAVFIVDGTEVKTSLGKIGDSQKVTLKHLDLECDVVMKQNSIVQVYKSKDCQLVPLEDVAGRTDVISDTWWNTYTKTITLKEEMYTIINQEVARLVDIVRDDEFNKFYPVFEINGEELKGNNASQASISVFGK